MTRSTLFATALCALSISGCAGLPLTYGSYGGGGSGLVCDELGADADARKIEAFLTTADRFERETNALASDVEATCASMAADLGITVPRATEGSLQVDATCRAVATPGGVHLLALSSNTDLHHLGPSTTSPTGFDSGAVIQTGVALMTATALAQGDLQLFLIGTAHATMMQMI